MQVRSASPQDFEAIMAIEQSAHFHPWPESVLRRYLEKPDCTFVIEDSRRILGYAVITLIAGEAELLMVAVDPACQGKGAGRTLMDYLHFFLTQKGAEQWFLDVRESNHKAISLYESMGFCQAGVRSGYYPTANGKEDALLYCLDLSDDS